MHLPLVIDELHRKGPQELLKHLDETGIRAAATTQSGKLNLGTPKFEEDKENFLSLIVPHPSREHAQHSTVISYYYILSDSCYFSV